MSNVKSPITNNRSGYTLIEILVGITIVGIVFLSGYVAFREFSRRQAIRSASRQIIADMRLAQAQAFAGKKPDTSVCNSPNVLQGYNFRVTSTTSYEVTVQCSGGTDIIKTADLPSIVTLQAPAQNPMLFKILGQGTNFGANQSLRVTVYGLTQTISITTGGSIE